MKTASNFVERVTTEPLTDPVAFRELLSDLLASLRGPNDSEDEREAGRLLPDQVAQRLLDMIVTADAKRVCSLIDLLRRAQDDSFMVGLLPSARLRARLAVIEELAETYLRREAVVRRKSHPGGVDEDLGDLEVRDSFSLRGDTRFRSLTIHAGAVLNQGRHSFVV